MSKATPPRNLRSTHLGLLVDFGEGQRYHPCMEEASFEEARRLTPQTTKSDFLLDVLTSIVPRYRWGKKGVSKHLFEAGRRTVLENEAAIRQLLTL
jgi:hypothetical protein